MILEKAWLAFKTGNGNTGNGAKTKTKTKTKTQTKTKTKTKAAATVAEASYQDISDDNATDAGDILHCFIGLVCTMRKIDEFGASLVELGYKGILSTVGGYRNSCSSLIHLTHRVGNAPDFRNASYDLY